MENDANRPFALAFIDRLANTPALTDRLPDFNLDAIHKEASELHMLYLQQRLFPGSYLFASREEHDSMKGHLTSSQLTPYENLKPFQRQLWMAATQKASNYFLTLNPTAKNTLNELIQLVSPRLCTWLGTFETDHSEKSGHNLLPYMTCYYNPTDNEFTLYANEAVRKILCYCTLSVQCDYPSRPFKPSQRPYGSGPDIHAVIQDKLSTLLYQIAEKVHTAECKYKIDNNWSYDTLYDTTAKTWPALLPFGKCYRNSELKKEVLYAIDVARVILHNLIKLV